MEEASGYSLDEMLARAKERQQLLDAESQKRHSQRQAAINAKSTIRELLRPLDDALLAKAQEVGRGGTYRIVDGWDSGEFPPVDIDRLAVAVCDYLESMRDDGILAYVNHVDQEPAPTAESVASSGMTLPELTKNWWARREVWGIVSLINERQGDTVHLKLHAMRQTCGPSSFRYAIQTLYDDMARGIRTQLETAKAGVEQQQVARADTNQISIAKSIEEPAKEPPWRAANEEPPAEFKYGPLTGTLKELGLRFEIDYRTVEGKLGPVRWGRKEHSRKYSIWFTNEREFNTLLAKQLSMPETT